MATDRGLAKFPAMNEALLHVGNLPYSIERDDLEAMFLNAGTVVSASLMTYKFDSRSSGYGFVEMASRELADAAVLVLSEMELEGGRKLQVRPVESPPGETLRGIWSGQPPSVLLASHQKRDGKRGSIMKFFL